MEDIYCDFDTVFDKIFDLVDSHDKNEDSIILQNVNVGLIEDLGKEGFADFLDIFPDVDVIYSDIGKVIFEYLSSNFVVLDYEKLNDIDTVFNIKIFNGIDDASDYYSTIN